MISPKSFIAKSKTHIFKIEKESVIAIAGIASEYYNIFYYGYMSHVIIPIFFIHRSRLITFLAILLSYIMGPLGAVICGHIGDKLGRKKILAWTVAFVSIPSFLLCILPTYDQIGLFASILFIVLRSIQTFAFGGDMLGLVTFILEDVPSRLRGLYAGFMSMGAAIGVLLSSLVVTLLGPFDDISTFSWKWRVPLSVSIFGLIVAIYFYRVFGETVTFNHYKKTQFKRTWPILDLFKTYKLILLRIIGLTALVPIITIVIFGFIPFLGMKHLGLSPTTSMWSNTIALLIFAISAPFFGAKSDKWGRKPVLLSISLFFLILGYPLFSLLDYLDKGEKGVIEIFFFVQLLFSFLSSAYYGVTMAACVEQLPTHIRYTGVALGYYITYALFGGINGLYIVSILLEDVKIDFSAVFYLLLGSLLVLISSLSLQEDASLKLPE